jgi:hypothetical protein
MFAPLAIVKRFGTLKKALGSGTATDVVSRLRRVAQSAGEEGLQEAVTEVGQNLIAQGVYDPNTGTFSGTGESFGLGAGVGGLLQGLFELALPKTRGGSRELSVVERQALGLDEEGVVAEEGAVTGELLPPEQALAGPPEPQDRVGLPAPRPEAIIVAPDGTAFPERYMDDYRTYRRERNAELAAVAPETRQAREAELARKFLADKEVEEAAAVTEAARLRREAPQMELFPDLRGQEKTKVTTEDLVKLGIPKTSRFATTLPKLDLAKPEEARTAAAEIVRYANLPTTKKNPARREAAFGLLNLPAIRALEATAPTPTPTSIEEASRQMSIQEPIATSRIEEQRAEEAARIAAERDAAFAAAEAERVAQEAAIPQQTEAAFEEARDRRREELLAADTRARMATPEAGAITSPVALALERAKTAGGQRPGQAQLEIQDNVALSTGQQDSFSPEAVGTVPTQQGPTIDEQIAEAQRVLAQLETQKAEQGEMFGPEGGVLRGADRFAFTREGEAEAAEARAMEKEITTKARRTGAARKAAATKAAKKDAEEKAAKKATEEKAEAKRAAAAKKAAEEKAAKAKEVEAAKAETAARSAAAAAAAPVVEEAVVEDVVEDVVEEDVTTAEEEVEAAEFDADTDADAEAARLELIKNASRKAKNKASEPKKASKRAANVDEDIKKLKALKKGNPFYEYFTKIKI